MPKKWKVCMVGMGSISDIHFQAWQSVKNAEIVALCDFDESKLRQKSALHNVPRAALFASLDKALREVKIDVVDIITRPDSHLPLVETAAKARKHILCQKTFAPDVAQAKKMVKICREQGVTLMVSEGWRWMPQNRMIKQTLREGTLGQVHFAKICGKWNFTPGFTSPEKMDQPYFLQMDRLLLFEMGPHWIDTYLHFFGEPEHVSATIKRVSPHILGDDLAILVFQHKDMIGLLEASWTSKEFVQGSHTWENGVNLMDHIVIEGTEATLRLDIQGNLDIIYGKDQIEKIDYTPCDYADGHKLLHQHFVDCLDNGTEPATSGESNVKVMEIIENAYSYSAKLNGSY